MKSYSTYLLVSWSVLSIFTEVRASHNLARNKPTEQISDFNSNWTSSRAVDGCTNQKIGQNCCSHTKTVGENGEPKPKEAWWWVDLQQQSTIDTVGIIYRDEGTLHRLTGFQIYLSNTSDWRLGERCYHDNTARPQLMTAIQNVTCQGVAQYVAIYSDLREKSKPWYWNVAVLELCEVFVYGCPVGMYGNGHCNDFCTGCLADSCDPVTGECGKCKPKFSGPYCRCPSNCRDTTCPKSTGHCTDCNDGYYGPTCTQCPTGCITNTCDKTLGRCIQCAAGFYGSHCSESCQVNCKNEVCSREDGHCEECNVGYYGPTCTPCPTGCRIKSCDKTSGRCLQCAAGFYGSHCSESCPVNCKNEVCVREDGQCTECGAGFYGSHCNMSCPANCNNKVCAKADGYCAECGVDFYGRQCNMSCPANCKNNICAKADGDCADCTDGFYEIHCNIPCPMNCKGNICANEDGHCTDGCDDGFSGRRCDCPEHCGDNSCPNGDCTDCQDGYFGSLCTPCPVNCSNATCDKTSGDCFECIIGRHGGSCNQSCPDRCHNDVCDQMKGTCKECDSGFHGVLCNQTCQNNCENDICRIQDGICIVAISQTDDDENQYAWFSLLVVIPIALIVVIVRRNRKKSHARDKSNVRFETISETSKSSSSNTEQPNASDEFTRKSRDNESPNGGQIIFGNCDTKRPQTGLLVPRNSRYNVRHKSSLWISEGSRDNGRPKSSLGVYGNSRDNGRPKSSQWVSGNAVHEYHMVCGLGVANHHGSEYVNVIDIMKENEAPCNMHTGVSIEEIRAMIPKKMENEEEEFKKEFKMLPWGAVHPHIEGSKPANKTKNRYKGTYPYDHSRVVLDRIGNDPNSTYINANYIDGVGASRQTYVACQGPKERTVDDFWRMIWQLNTGKIVMVTNLKEGRNDKCHQYWPDEGQSLITKYFKVTLNQERVYAFYVLRAITLNQKKSNEERQIHQFHFTAWPDHFTPNSLELVLFHRRVTSYSTYLTGPMVVHCSAGIGRTGTFIGLDALSKEEKRTGRVDISQYIRTMRKDRLNMVQTHGQYIAIHELLVEAADLPDTLIPCSQFHEVMRNFLLPGEPTNRTMLRKEFNVLLELVPKYDSENYTAGLMERNKDKNETLSNIAVDRYRVFLQSQARDRTDYINAVILQSHRSKFGYLMTQFPLADTVDDFWAMVTDYSCENIVVLGTPTEPWLYSERETDESYQTYVEKKTEMDVIPEINIVEYIVTNKISMSSASVRVYTMTVWSLDTLLPPSNSSLLQLLEQLGSRRRCAADKPVVVMCRDGCTQSGLFCCLSNIRDQMKMDEEVDIFQTARQIQIRCPQALGNIDQYQYCYKMIELYLESTDLYMN